MMGGAIVEWRSSSPSVVSTNLPLPVASPFETCFHFTISNTNTNSCCLSIEDLRTQLPEYVAVLLPFKDRLQSSG